MASKAHALHILVKHKEQADDILKQLKQGAKFQTLATKYSTCPSGKKGGDLGEFRKGAMVPQFDKAVFSGKAISTSEALKMKNNHMRGLIPEPVKTKFGWHIIKVLYVV
ncbi:peptidylprolyl isomerase [Photobacterium aquae]|uniref:peptidylprolyl isomerase n=1 Tax=Photobacterium aquae TaxID=1195763 RepID=A0A0J1GUP9_9GAMM|nr:peptidylprolyl isomerase [Photobacterium aquae]KLV03391.1 peptidylprolyl isomerase [Photobacterium aquae]